MKTIKLTFLMLFIGFILGITSTLVWQRYFEIVPRSSIDSGDIRGLAWQAARRYHIDVTLLFAIIDQESKWNPGAISPKGAMGLMQIMPETAKLECGITEENQLFDPALNLECGTLYFSRLLKHFGTVKLALCAYNSGPNRVAELGRCPRLRETTNYTQTILANWRGE